MAQEIELKLELTPEAAQALLAADLPFGAITIVRLRSVYFDTPERDLRSAGLSLRIREKDGQRIQTVKAAGAGAAGLFARPEWERPLSADRPMLDDSTPIRTLLGDKAHEIGPLFEVRVERTVWTVDRDGATVELSLDRGEVASGERLSPVCEIELELKKGSPAALFTLAREIDTVVPLRPSVLDKAERGFRLLAPAERAVKAEPVLLAPDATAAVAFRQIATACLRQFRLNEPLVEHGNGEAVHQARVALRRLRSAFSIFKPLLEDETFGRLKEEARWLAGSLGDARDLDVLITRQDDEDERRRELERAREDAYAAAAAALASDRARAFMLDLSEWLALGDWLTRPQDEEMREQPARAFAASALDRLRRKVKKGGRDLSELDDEARHEVRKDAKKLRYAAEFFVSLFDDRRRKRRAKRFLAALEALQDRLGALNDLAVESEVLGRNGLEEGGSSADDGARRKRALVEEAAEAHDAFVDAKRFWR